jgi:hypothetical protein
MRPTRRELLASALALPLSFSLTRTQIIHGGTLLSEESARGFRLLLGSVSVPLIVLPATQTISQPLALRLRHAALAGSWILIESGLCFESASNWKQLSRVLRGAFHLEIAAPVQALDRYIHFEWPQRALVRTFEAVTPVTCPPTELIARLNGLAVGARRSLGQGGVIFLGSMLGPALAAEEREAHALCSQILRKIFRRYIQNRTSQ